MLEVVKERLKLLQINISFNDEAKKHLSKVWLNTNYGARPLRRELTKSVENMLYAPF